MSAKSAKRPIEWRSLGIADSGDVGEAAVACVGRWWLSIRREHVWNRGENRFDTKRTHWVIEVVNLGKPKRHQLFTQLPGSKPIVAAQSRAEHGVEMLEELVGR